MKRIFIYLFICLLYTSHNELNAQKKPGAEDLITASDLEAYDRFISSPLLMGRANGQPGLEIAQEFIVSQARLLGLKPANGDSYYQPYPVIESLMDPEKTRIVVTGENNHTAIINKPIFQVLPTGPSDFELEGEVMFAGYGLRQEKYSYNDLDNMKPEGKILLIMTGAPSSEDGKKFLFEGVDWNSFDNLQVKLSWLMFSKAKAIVIVMNPKSGFDNLDEQYPGVALQLNSSMELKGQKQMSFPFSGLPKILFVHRSVADSLLAGTGNTLEDLQKKIDTSLKPYSFIIPGKQLKITEAKISTEKTLNNVAAYIEGSDPVLKNEVVVFSAHVDHIGVSMNGEVNQGADDDASGSSALLSMAEAFQSLEKKPLRSILFLWVSGEEVGLYGSKSYVTNPLFPLDKTIADLNMDMIGRVKAAADSTSETPMTDRNHVFVIACNQSKELIEIANEADRNSVMDFDYSLSGRQHPLQLFSRSDHYNFVKNDIPVLFFSTGLHSDYHTPGDVADKIDFAKMQEVTRTMYRIGLKLASQKTRIVVDNPFSKW